MKKWGKHIIRIAIAFLGLMLTQSSYAQCAMCKAVAEDSINENGWGIALGLNSGIMLLMFVPYLLLASLFLIFFRKQITGFFKSFSNIHS